MICSVPCDIPFADCDAADAMTTATEAVLFACEECDDDRDEIETDVLEELEEAKLLETDVDPFVPVLPAELNTPAIFCEENRLETLETNDPCDVDETDDVFEAEVSAAELRPECDEDERGLWENPALEEESLLEESTEEDLLEENTEEDILEESTEEDIPEESTEDCAEDWVAEKPDDPREDAINELWELTADPELLELCDCEKLLENEKENSLEEKLFAELELDREPSTPAAPPAPSPPPAGPFAPFPPLLPPFDPAALEPPPPPGPPPHVADIHVSFVVSTFTQNPKEQTHML